MNEPPPPPAIKLEPDPPRRRWRIILAIVLSLFAFAALGAAWSYHLYHATPAHWRSNQQLLAQDNATLVSLADRAERRLLRATSAEGGIQFGEERMVPMSFDEVNAWLALKFTDWSAYFDLPMLPDIEQPMLAADGDRLVAAFTMESRGIAQVISVTMDLRPQDDGQAHLRVHRVHIGKLRLPFLKTLVGLSGQADEQATQMIHDVLDGRSFDPVFDHPGDARLRLRLTGLHLSEAGMELTLRAERP